MTTRRYIKLFLALAIAAVALIASGCGGSSGGSGNGLDTALNYVPKNALVVVAINTDTEGSQYKQLNTLIGKFPFGGQVKQGFKTGFNSSASLDYDKDFKPLLGNDIVVAINTPTGALSGSNAKYVAAWKVDNQDAAKKLIGIQATKVGNAEGADIYKKSNSSGTFYAYKDGAIIAAGTQADLQAALKRAGGGDHMTVDDFNAALGDLKQDGLVRVAGSLQALIGTDPKALAARKVKWIGALRSFGSVLSAEPDGISLGFQSKTEGSLGSRDLPIALGAQSAPVVRRAGEVGIGLRNPAQIIKFGQVVAQITNPKGYAKYTRDMAKMNKQLGINIDRDVIGQLTGNSAVSVTLNGDFAVRADVRDPAAAQATLKKAAPRLAKLAKGKSLGLSTPKNGQGFYALAQANGKKVVFGVVGKSFVAATDAGRAAQFAGESPSVVPGVKGAIVVASDARSLANAIAQRRGQGTAGQVLSGSLGDLIGSIESETSGLTASFKLQIK